LAPGRNHAFLCCGGSSIVLSVSQDLHWIAQFSLAEEKKRLPARVVRATVVGRLGRHVGEIDSFVKHIPVDWGLWRRNTKTLTKDTAVVGSA
jgi:hypothetical protein